MDRVLLISRCRITKERVTGTKKRAVVHQPKSTMTMRREKEVHSIHEHGEGQEISIKRHLIKLHDNIQSEESFKIGVVILTSLMRCRYTSATRSEQRQLFSSVCKVATLLSTQFSGTDFWRVGLELFQAAKLVTTELDELMHIRVCTDVAKGFLDDDQQREGIITATATTSDSSNSVGLNHLVLDPMQQLRSTYADRERWMLSSGRERTGGSRKDRGASKKPISVQTAAQNCQEKRSSVSKLSSHKKKKKKHVAEVCKEQKVLPEPSSVSLIESHVCPEEQRALTNPHDTEMMEVIATPEETNNKPGPVLLVPGPEEDTSGAPSLKFDSTPVLTEPEKAIYEAPNLLSDPVPLVTELELSSPEEPIVEPETEVSSPEEPVIEPEALLLVPGQEAPSFLMLGDPAVRLFRSLTMEELGREIQVILQRVSMTFAIRNLAMAEEFVGLQDAIQATLQEINNIPRGPPPAAKEEIEKLSITTVTSSVLTTLGEDIHCAVCREPLVLGDNMQEMPCRHPYHPECLKPWLENHNSCPICRFELRTDDENYERQKQLKHDAEILRGQNY